MGSLLGPSFANIFMCALEQSFLSNCHLHCKPLLYRRYVDDTFCIFKNKSQAENFLKYLNQQRSNISFTYELEAKNSLQFLDVLITHAGNVFLLIYIARKRLQVCIPILTAYHLYNIKLISYRSHLSCISYLLILFLVP